MKEEDEESTWRSKMSRPDTNNMSAVLFGLSWSDNITTKICSADYETQCVLPTRHNMLTTGFVYEDDEQEWNDPIFHSRMEQFLQQKAILYYDTGGSLEMRDCPRRTHRDQ